MFYDNHKHIYDEKKYFTYSLVSHLSVFCSSQVSQHAKTEGLNDSIGHGLDADVLAQKMNLLGTGVSQNIWSYEWKVGVENVQIGRLMSGKLA